MNEVIDGPDFNMQPVFRSKTGASSGLVVMMVGFRNKEGRLVLGTKRCLHWWNDRGVKV